MGVLECTDASTREVLVDGLGGGVYQAEGVLFPFGADGQEVARGVELEVGDGGGQVHDGLRGGCAQWGVA